MMAATFPAWACNALLYEMNIRQLTPEGTFRAAAEKLPFLRELGIDALWLMPVTPIGIEGRKGSLGSFYSVRDYCAVNPEFGTMADFDAFVARAHALGMKVILDWVANHTARDARWIAEKPADWYEREADGSPKVPWDWTDTAKLNYENRAVWRGQIEAMRFWIEHHAVDGFRCDMAMLVPIGFWQEVARELRAVKPDLFLLAEAEQPDLFDQGAFHVCYGWEVHHLMNDIAQQRCRLHPLREKLYAGGYPETAVRMLFTSNHDENSWSGSEYARMGAASEVMAVLSFLWPRSMPLIYTGQEVGYDHSFAFFEHDPIPDYRPTERTELYRRLAALKHAHPALRCDAPFVEIRNNAEDCLLSLVRRQGDDCVVGLLNLSPYTIQLDFETGIYAGRYTDAMTGGAVELPAHIHAYLDPWNYRILTRTEKPVIP